MASVCFSEDLTCSICLSVFTDPVMLQCGHSFCRKCISVSLNKQSHCPVCRVDAEGQSLLTNHVLKSLVEKSKQKLQYRQYRHNKEKAEFLCPEHEEKLKLFCITDQKLICVVCRDSLKHESHQFKPVSEAAALVRAELEDGVKKTPADTSALEKLAQAQKGEMDRTKQRSEELKSMISSKFEEMHKFLQKRERELTDQVQSDEDKMTERLRHIELAIAENRNLEAIAKYVLPIQDDERFLKKWSEEREAKAIKCPFKPKGGDFQVQKTELSLGPYESHLQMFVWKEMLQVVTPREEQLLLEKDQTSLMVSQDQHCATFCSFTQQVQQLQQQLKNLQQQNNRYNSGGYSVSTSYNTVQSQGPSTTQSTNTFAGQHYWEVYVGQHSDWELGVPDCYLKNKAGAFQIYTSRNCTSWYDTTQYYSSQYNTSQFNTSRYYTVQVQGKPQKIGIYLNCLRKELSFYDADNTTHIRTMSLTHVRFPVSAHFVLGDSNSSHDPLVVCRY